MRGQARRSPVLVQRAVSEDPRWTRAVGDHLARPPSRRWSAHDRNVVARCAQSRATLATPLKEGEDKARAIEDRPGYPWGKLG
jgi:hypothetical protein